jgi:hypothetical protein
MISDRDRRIFPYIFPSAIFISVFIGCISLGPLLFNVDGDLGRHLTLGGYILQSGNIPTADIFSQTMTGQPLSPHEWLAAVIFRLCYNAMGFSGVVLFSAGLLASVFWLISYRVYRCSRSTIIAVILVVLGIAGSRIHWLARPHIFTYLFLFLWLELLQQQTRYIFKWMLTSGLMLLWVNTHGAFITGMVVLGILIAGAILDGIHWKDRRKAVRLVLQYLVLLLTSLGISLINPSGVEIWRTIAGFLGSRYLVTHTAEYMRPVLSQVGVMPFTILATLGVLLVCFNWKKLPADKILLVIIFAAFGVMSGRNIPLYILAALPVMAEAAALLWPGLRGRLDRDFTEEPAEPDRRTISNRIIWLCGIIFCCTVIGAACLKFIPGLAARNSYNPKKYPVQAMDWLISHPQPGNIFNDFMWGGYILYRDWPDQKVFIDGQTDFYGEALTRDYETVVELYSGWQDVLEKHQIVWMLIPVNSKLADTLSKNPSEWKILYEDQTSVILRKY